MDLRTLSLPVLVQEGSNEFRTAVLRQAVDLSFLIEHVRRITGCHFVSAVKYGQLLFFEKMKNTNL